MKFGQVYQSEAGYSLERQSYYSQELLGALTLSENKRENCVNATVTPG